jgi:hypothetical protein
MRVKGYGFGTPIPASARPDGSSFYPLSSPSGSFPYQTLPICCGYPAGYQVSGTHCHPESAQNTAVGPLYGSRSWFRAERHDNGYKLTSCRKEPCRDLGLYHYRGHRWLTVEKDGRQPFEVVFKKCPFGRAVLV